MNTYSRKSELTSLQKSQNQSVPKAPKRIQASTCAVPVTRILATFVFQFPNLAVCCRRRCSPFPFSICMATSWSGAAKIAANPLLLYDWRVCNDLMVYDWVDTLFHGWRPSARAWIPYPNPGPAHGRDV